MRPKPATPRPAQIDVVAETSSIYSRLSNLSVRLSEQNSQAEHLVNCLQGEAANNCGSNPESSHVPSLLDYLVSCEMATSALENRLNDLVRLIG